MKKRPLFPIGLSNFGKLIKHRNSNGNQYTFIDKTLLIKDFIDSDDEVTLITRPRRFGKTLNMSMLQHFFAPEVDGESTKGLFDNLKISKYPEVMKYQGKYPVIFISFKDVKGDTFEEAFDEIKETTRNLFKNHKYLLDSEIITEDEKYDINNFIKNEATFSKYKSSLYILSNMLYSFYGKKVIILIDEYDTPLHEAYANEYYEEMRKFISALFGKALKDNRNLYKSIITGILKISKSSLFSGLNNVEDYTMWHSPFYAQYFGFTEDEVEYLLKSCNLTQVLPKLKEVYNGYLINDITLYNPFSVIKFLKNASIAKNEESIKESIRYYWINSGSNTILKKVTANNLSLIQSDLSNLIGKKSVKSEIDENIVIGNVLDNNPVAYWSLLLMSGYLKVMGQKLNTKRKIEYEVKFPNEEVRISMENMFIELVSINNSTQHNAAMNNLVNGEIELFREYMSEYLRRTPSFLDEDGRFREQFYHGILLGMTACLSHAYIIKSNRESGKGRYDIALEPKKKTNRGVIIELKSPDKEADLEKESKSALKQIKNLKYESEMRERGIKNFIHLGIAFRRKEIEIVEKFI